MFIFGGLIGAIIFVTLGYFAFWTATRPDTSHDVANFGKIMAIILFVIAGLILIFGTIGGAFWGPMMGRGMMHPGMWGR